MAMRQGALDIGDVLNENYKIEAFIAEGATGEIYRANQTATGSTVAIKVLKDIYSRNQAHIDLMRRELIRDVKDPAIVRYIDLMWTEFRGGFYYLVMEYIPGPSLAQVMRDGPVDTDTLITIGRVLSSGLEAAHAAQILHRDISPDNILLRDRRPDGATLIDFGVAKDLKPDARTVVNGGFAGKYEYAAPEQIDGKADARSDIYALGATLLAAAKGETPRLPHGIKDIYDLKVEPVDLSGVAQPLRGLLARMLAPRPEDRFPDAASMSRAFDEADIDSDEDVLEDVVTFDSPGSGSGKERPYGATKRRRAWGRPVAFLGLAAALCAALWFSPARQFILEPRLPLVDKYMFIAEDASRTLSGNAPSEEARTRLIETAERAFGGPSTAALSLAREAPGESWVDGVAGLIDAAAPLEDWQIEVIDDSASLKGEAATTEIKTAVERAARNAASSHGLTIEGMRIKVRIDPVDARELAAMAAAYADCGALSVTPGAGMIGPEDGVGVVGDISSADRASELRTELEKLAVGRPLSVQLRARNEYVCQAKSILPRSEPGSLALVFYSETRAAPKADDGFAANDLVVIDLETPAALDGYVHAFLVGNDGHNINLLPHTYRPSNRLSEIGDVMGDRRTIRLTLERSEIEGSDSSRFGIEMGEPYGDWLVAALLTKEPLFAGLTRLSSEHIDAFAPELASQLNRMRRQDGVIASVQRMVEFAD